MLASNILNFVTTSDEPKYWLSPSISSLCPKGREKISSSSTAPCHSHSSSSIFLPLENGSCLNRFMKSSSLGYSLSSEIPLKSLGSQQLSKRCRLSYLGQQLKFSSSIDLVLFLVDRAIPQTSLLSTSMGIISLHLSEEEEGLLFPQLCFFSERLLSLDSLGELSLSRLQESAQRPKSSMMAACFLFLQFFLKSCIFKISQSRCCQGSSRLIRYSLATNPEMSSRMRFAMETTSMLVRRTLLSKWPSTTAMSLLRQSASN